MAIREYAIEISYDDGTTSIERLRAFTGEAALLRGLHNALLQRDMISHRHPLGETPAEGLRLVVGARIADDSANAKPEREEP